MSTLKRHRNPVETRLGPNGKLQRTVFSSQDPVRQNEVPCAFRSHHPTSVVPAISRREIGVPVPPLSSPSPPPACLSRLLAHASLITLAVPPPKFCAVHRDIPWPPTEPPHSPAPAGASSVSTQPASLPTFPLWIPRSGCWLCQRVPCFSVSLTSRLWDFSFHIWEVS